MPLKVVVVLILGCLLTESATASKTGVVTLVVQLALAGQILLPPPETVTVFTLGVTALELTLTGTVRVTVPVAIGLARLQPAKLVAPTPGQPDKLPLLAVMAPLLTTPAGKASVRLIAAVVGPLTTSMAIK